MKKVLVLGSTGMLGHAVVSVLNNVKGIQVLTTARRENDGGIKFNVENDNITDLITLLNPDYIVNCIGIIKPHINENSPSSINRAIEVNSRFPIELAEATNGLIIQIATDCVYSGSKGAYTESDPHDANDVYGKTKSLGEVPAENVMHIRASIIGPELGRSTSLLEWFKNQPINSKLNGFTDHLWNGVTTYAFGKLCEGIIKQNSFRSGKYHVIPRDIVTKADLLRIFSKAYKRLDLLITDTVSTNKVDRTLSTNDLNFVNNLWVAAGYRISPSIEEMVLEQAKISALFPEA